MKKLLLIFSLLMTSIVGAFAGEVKYDFTTQEYGLTRETDNNSGYIENGVVCENAPVSMKLFKADSTNGMRLWSDGLRFYKNSEAGFELSVPSGQIITKVTIEVVSGATFKLDGDEDNNTTWNLSAQTAKFKYTATQNKALKTVTVIYEEDKTPKAIVHMNEPEKGVLLVVNADTGESLVAGEDNEVAIGANLRIGAMPFIGDLISFTANGVDFPLTDDGGYYSAIYTVEGDVDFVATFGTLATVSYTVNDPSMGIAIVANNSTNESLEAGKEYQLAEGTVLRLGALPFVGQLLSFTANGTELPVDEIMSSNGYLYTVEGDVKFAVEFGTPVAKYTIDVQTEGNGTVTIRDDKDNTYESGAAIPANADLTLVFAPAEGFRLASALLGEDDLVEYDLITEEGTYWLGNLNKDEVLKVVFEAEAFTYTIPAGTRDTGNGHETYVEAITTTGAATELNVSYTAEPANLYTLVEETAEVLPGTEFTLNLTAHSKGDYSTSTVYQDLRYTCAHLWVDWSGKGEWTSLGCIGDIPPSHNVGGNKEVMDIAQTIAVPADAEIGLEGRVRVIYASAWSVPGATSNSQSQGKNGADPNSQYVKEGVAYDIIVKVVSAPSHEYQVEGDAILASDIIAAKGGKMLYAAMSNATMKEEFAFNGAKGTGDDVTYQGHMFEGVEEADLENPAIVFKIGGTLSTNIRNTKSGNKLQEVQVLWNENTPDGAVLTVYGRSTAFTTPYSWPATSKLGEITKVAGEKIGKFTVESGVYPYFGMKATTSSTNFVIVDEIGIVWAQPETYTLYISEVENGTIEVKKGTETVADNATVNDNDELTVIATPAEGYEFESILVNGVELEGVTVDANGVATGKFTPDDDTMVGATFKEKAVVVPTPSDNMAICLPERTTYGDGSAYRLEVNESVMLDRASAEKVGGEWPIVSKSFTMMGWYKAISFASYNYNNGGVLMGHQPRCHVNYNGAFTLAVDNSGNLKFGGKYNTASGQIMMATTLDGKLELDQWTNLAVVYDAEAQTMTAYMNGEQIGQKELNAPLTVFPDNPGVVTFGSINANSWIDEAAFYGEALSADEIAQAMNNAAALNPVCLYTFDETPATAGTYANTGSSDVPAVIYRCSGSASSDGGVISCGSFTATAAADTQEGREIVNAVEYCTWEGNSNHVSRYTNGVRLEGSEGTTYTFDGLQTAPKQAVYWDATENVATFSAGETVTVYPDYRQNATANSGEWMHSYAYVDYNRDGVFDIENLDDYVPNATSELVGFCAFNRGAAKGGSDEWINSKGEPAAGGDNPNKKPFSFTLPVNLKPGDYRFRMKIDWSCIDPCGNSASNNLISNNGGIIADFTLRISAVAPRTISVATNDAALGKAEILSPATEEASVKTSEVVTVKATVTDEDAYFVNWTNAEGKEVSTDAEYTYTGADDIELTANFRQHYLLTINDAENGTTVNSSLGQLANGDMVDRGTELNVRCNVSGMQLVSLLVNGVEVIESYGDAGYSFTMTEATVIEPEYALPTFKLSITAGENGTVVASSAVSEAGEPAGDIFVDGDTFEDGDEVYIVATPNEGYKVESLVIDGDAYVENGEAVENPDLTFYEAARVYTFYCYIFDNVNVSATFVRDSNAIESIGVDELNGAEIYNLQGVRVARENLVPGVYVRVNAAGAQKVYIK